MPNSNKKFIVIFYFIIVIVIVVLFFSSYPLQTFTDFFTSKEKQEESISKAEPEVIEEETILVAEEEAINQIVPKNEVVKEEEPILNFVELVINNKTERIELNNEDTKSINLKQKLNATTVTLKSFQIPKSYQIVDANNKNKVVESTQNLKVLNDEINLLVIHKQKKQIKKKYTIFFASPPEVKALLIGFHKIVFRITFHNNLAKDAMLVVSPNSKDIRFPRRTSPSSGFINREFKKNTPRTVYFAQTKDLNLDALQKGFYLIQDKKKNWGFIESNQEYFLFIQYETKGNNKQVVKIPFKTAQYPIYASEAFKANLFLLPKLSLLGIEYKAGEEPLIFDVSLTFNNDTTAFYTTIDNKSKKQLIGKCQVGKCQTFSSKIFNYEAEASFYNKAEVYTYLIVNQDNNNISSFIIDKGDNGINSINIPIRIIKK